MKAWREEFHLEHTEGVPVTEFRLIYEGPLPSGNDPQVKAKHAIRQQLHKQLVKLWQDHPLLKQGLERWARPQHQPDPPLLRSAMDDIADAYAMFGYRFVPLIRKSQGVTCSIDILFLRRDVPGGIVSNRGDLDNRIKVLFDGLRIPDNANELPPGAPLPDEDPLFCLLQDDKLITDISVTSDRLLKPLAAGSANTHDVADVVLILAVTVKASEADDWTCHFTP